MVANCVHRDHLKHKETTSRRFARGMITPSRRPHAAAVPVAVKPPVWSLLRLPPRPNHASPTSPLRLPPRPTHASVEPPLRLPKHRCRSSYRQASRRVSSRLPRPLIRDSIPPVTRVFFFVADTLPRVACRDLKKSWRISLMRQDPIVI